MKIGGVQLKGPAKDVLVLQRPTGDDIVFWAEAVTSSDAFDKIVSVPKPGVIRRPGKEAEADFEGEGYIKASQRYATLKYLWFCLESLKPSNIEWDTVDMGDPNTWENWVDDLKNNGISKTERERIQVLISRVNSLDEKALDQAREDFLLGLAEELKEPSTGLNTEPKSTPSGPPAKDSESDLQE